MVPLDPSVLVAGPSITSKSLNVELAEDQSEASVTVVKAFKFCGGPYKSEKNLANLFAAFSLQG